MAPQPIPREALLRLDEVMRLTSLSQSEVYRRMSAATFPIPRKLGGHRVAWPAGEVLDWIAAAPRATIRSNRKAPPQKADAA